MEKKEPQFIFKFNEKPKNWALKALGQFLYFLVAFFLISYIIFNIIFFEAVVEGRSMQPTLNKLGGSKNDIVYVNRYSKINYGDIIVGNVNGTNVIKRVIALSGDKIRYEYNETNGICELYINGNLKSESYIKEPVRIKGDLLSNLFPGGEAYIKENVFKNNNGTENINDDFYEYVVPKDSVFYMGDNRYNSTDCRNYGAVNLKNIKGKVSYIVPYGVSKFDFWIKELF